MRCLVIDMTLEDNRRPAVEVSVRAGHKNKEIIKWFKFPKSMVYHFEKAYETSYDKGNFSLEQITYKKSFGATRTPKFVTEFVKENHRKT